MNVESLARSMTRWTALVAGAVILSTSVAHAQEVTKAVPTVEETLSASVGKTVTIRLNGGEDLTGKVSAVDGHTLLLTELLGKEFYSATIKTEIVSAVIYRAK